MPRTATLLVFACGVALAAPVPKAGPKLEDVFGEVADPKSECKFEMGKSGKLTVTVPTSHPVVEASALVVADPLVSRAVRGDFVLTVRVGHTVRDTVGEAEGAKKTTMTAGIALIPDGPPDAKARVCFVHAKRKEADGWYGLVSICYTSETGGGGRGCGGPESIGEDKYLRLTRTGETLVAEASSDGRSWYPINTQEVSGLPTALRVGPVAFQSTTDVYTATFDQYEITPLKDEKK